MIHTIKQHIVRLYDPLVSNWDSTFQLEAPRNSHLPIATYKFSAKAIQTALFTGAFAASYAWATSLNPQNPFLGRLGIELQCLCLCYRIICFIHESVQFHTIYTLKLRTKEPYKLCSLYWQDLCCQFKLMDTSSLLNNAIATVALCMFGGFSGVSVTLGLQAALLANGHFWRFQSDQFIHQNPPPCQPNVDHNSKDLKKFCRLNNLHINKDFLSQLLQLLPSKPVSLDLRGELEISIMELSEILKKWPQVLTQIRVGKSFSWQEIYWLQKENPTAHIEYDTRLEEMVELFEKQSDTDIIFQLDTCKVKAHSFIFAAFENALPLPTLPILISGISEENFKSLLKKIYLGMLSSEEHADLKKLTTQPPNFFEGSYSPDYLKALFSSATHVPNGITVHMEEKSYSLHPAILKSRNPYFKTAIETALNTTRTVNLKELGNLGPALLQYTYTNTFPLSQMTSEQFTKLFLYIERTDLRRVAELAYYRFLVEERMLSKSFGCLLSLVSGMRTFHQEGSSLCVAKINYWIRDRWGISLSSSEENEEHLDVLTIHTLNLYSFQDIQNLKGIREIVLEIPEEKTSPSFSETRSKERHLILKNFIQIQKSTLSLRFRSGVSFDQILTYSYIAKIKEVHLFATSFFRKKQIKRLEVFLTKQKDHLEKFHFGCECLISEQSLQQLKNLDSAKVKMTVDPSVKIIYFKSKEISLYPVFFSSTTGFPLKSS